MVAINRQKSGKRWVHLETLKFAKGETTHFMILGPGFVPLRDTENRIIVFRSRESAQRYAMKRLDTEFGVAGMTDTNWALFEKSENFIIAGEQ